MKKTTTKKKTVSVTDAKLEKNTHRITKEISSRIESLNKRESTFLFGNRSVCGQPIDVIRWLSETHPGSSIGLHTRNIILNALSESETAQGGSAVVCAASLSSLMSAGAIKSSFCMKEIENDLRSISTLSRRVSSSDIIDSLSRLDGDKISFSISKSAIKYCSANSSIQVDISENQTKIEKIREYKFQIQRPDIFYNSASVRSNLKFLRAKSIVIDGFIESMSEIDGLVQESFSSKTPLVIFSRGLSDDVQNTLGCNYSQGHLRVIPVNIPYDEVGVNLINDVSIVCGSDIVSSLKGDLITSRRWSDLPEVDSISIDFMSHQCLISNLSTQNQVRIHRRNLRKKRRELSSPAEIEIIDSRISSIMGNGIRVNLGKEVGDLKGIYKDRISTHIRLYKLASRFGMIKIEECIPIVRNHFLRESLKEILKISDSYSSSSLILGIRNSFICLGHLSSIGAIIHYDN
ncbi:MAG: hypothetical protein EBZ49_01440 [Proteobacteria bacterium]|nr:hypothetical protein [Pseudomonadota bacterium]